MAPLRAGEMVYNYITPRLQQQLGRYSRLFSRRRNRKEKKQKKSNHRAFVVYGTFCFFLIYPCSV